MRNRLILSASLLSLAALSFACGGAATNSNNSNTNGSNTYSNMMSNSSSNMMSNSTNMMGNSTNMMSNSAANKPANMASNMAANKPAAGNTMKSGTNTATNKIATTQKPPKGATALCKDGTYSFSKTDSGQCSSHGGVDKKL